MKPVSLDKEICDGSAIRGKEEEMYSIHAKRPVQRYDGGCDLPFRRATEHPTINHAVSFLAKRCAAGKRLDYYVRLQTAVVRIFLTDSL